MDLERACRIVEECGAMGDNKIKSLWEHLMKECIVRPHSVHGPDHWRKVERSGLLLAHC